MVKKKVKKPNPPERPDDKKENRTKRLDEAAESPEKFGFGGLPDIDMKKILGCG